MVDLGIHLRILIFFLIYAGFFSSVILWNKMHEFSIDQYVYGVWLSLIISHPAYLCHTNIVKCHTNIDQYTTQPKLNALIVKQVFWNVVYIRNSISVIQQPVNLKIQHGSETLLLRIYICNFIYKFVYGALYLNLNILPFKLKMYQVTWIRNLKSWPNLVSKSLWFSYWHRIQDCFTYRHRTSRYTLTYSH